jgi:hypothetical protein
VQLYQFAPVVLRMLIPDMILVFDAVATGIVDPRGHKSVRGSDPPQSSGADQ